MASFKKRSSFFAYHPKLKKTFGASCAQNDSLVFVDNY